MPITNHNQLNHNEITDQENNINTTEQNVQHLSRLQNEIGSKVLSLVNFESKHKDIVESSFNKARQNKEKLPGKNNERRNFAYLSRLDRIIEKHGDKAEQKIWEASAENVVMDYEDIPESYWKQQEQILRDNGQGRELSEYEKEILAEDLIDKQRQSITSWTNYLGDKNCPYPTWFKVYAFDGISKMSNTLNLDEADYNRRDNTTALSFPKLNAEILAKVYRQINNFYGVDKEDWLSKNSDDEKLISLVKSANFPKLYAKELVETKVILKTPERTEDVHGDWFEYKLGDEEEIASLAEGTHWCVVDPNVAHNYLVYGQYSNPGEDGDYDDYDDEDYEDDDQVESYDHDNIKVEKPEAKFIIFRLEDPNSPGIFASNGSASIRLDPNGIVDEVSGLNDGQAIEDALIPIVKEKTLSLPGGEKYLQKFDDKQTLIKLDNKMEAGEDLTKEELSFLYELDRPIATLDTYNREDPRIPELKEKYGIEYALEKGVDANKLVSSLDSYDITKNLGSLLKNGADIDNIVNNMDPDDTVYNLDILLGHNANININKLVSNLAPYDVNENLDSLLKNGADIDNVVSNMNSDDITEKLDYFLEHGAEINNIVSNMRSDNIVDKLDTLLEHNANININELVSNLGPYNIAENLDFLLEHGADINIDKLISDLRPKYIAKNLDSLLEHGADIYNIVKNLNSYYTIDNLDTLLEHGANIDVDQLHSKFQKDVTRNLNYLIMDGANINNIVNHMEPSHIVKNLYPLIKHHANIDNIIRNMDPDDISRRLDVFIKEYHADVNNIINNIESKDIAKNLGLLLKNGADINNIVNNMDPNDTAYNLDSLLGYNADIDVNKLVSNLDPYDIAENLDSFLKNGADIDNIVSNMGSFFGITKHLDTLLEYGADINNIVNNMDPYYIKQDIGALRKHGADINNIVNNMDPYDIDSNLYKLIRSGADINNIVKHMEPKDIIIRLDSLIEYGADIDVNKLVSSLDSAQIIKNLDSFIKNGADIDVNKLVSSLDSVQIANNLDSLIKNSANIDIDKLVSSLDSDSVYDNLLSLLRHGADVNNVIKNLDKEDIEDNIGLLRKYGANL